MLQLNSDERAMLGPAIFCEDELQKILARPDVRVERPNDKSIALIEPRDGKYCVAHAYVGSDVVQYAQSLRDRYGRVIYCSLRPGLARLVGRGVQVQRLTDREWMFT